MNKSKLIKKLEKWNSYSFKLKGMRGQKQVVLRIKGDFYLSFIYFCDEDDEIVEGNILKQNEDNEYETWEEVGTYIANIKDAYKLLLHSRNKIGQV